MRDDVTAEATARQRDASDPATSVWVAASAGSGKTTVLTDRVLALLLTDTRPERILCLTFTRAAAAEMAQRINRRLALWATEPDRDVRQEIAALLDRVPDDALLDRARQLFAHVLDVPGGLKIQTIHSFCQSLLGRFPLEAEIAPHFEAIDERSAAELLMTARDSVLSSARTGGPLADALDVVTGYIQEDSFGEMMAQLARDRGRIRRLIDMYGSIPSVAAALAKKLGIAPGRRAEDVVADACRDGVFDTDALAVAIDALLAGTEKTDQPRGQLIARWLTSDPSVRAASFADYAAGFLTQDGEPRKVLITRKAAEAAPDAAETLAIEAARLVRIMEQRRAAITAEATVALLQLGAALLDAYEKAKAALARLDYDDLILKTIALLRENVDAAWVLFKLDGGLDHILIDEAQDTNPDQWAVVAALAEEFFSGAGARPEVRTVFAVGDSKQSIFSFQRADPAAFSDMRRHFRDRIEAAEAAWRDVELNWSFRSTAPVLAAVDAVFDQDTARDGVIPDGVTIEHRAVRTGHAGSVEVWPLIGPRDTSPLAPWTPPLTREPADSPSTRLANALAHRLEGWIGCEALPSKGRLVRAGDIMVLVRRRNSFVTDLVSALKARDIPVAGVDRMVLSEQLAVMDLVALGDFLLLPEDDLTLATVMKGPFIGFDDDDLFTLAYNRGSTTLWHRLADMAADDDRFAAAYDWLARLLAIVDFSPPYELFARLLSEPTIAQDTGRQRIVARLGIEAEDPIEEFLNLALAHERTDVPSLQNFLHWLKAGDATITRDLEHSGRDEVRIITVHGAKGLQAPIVILPDTTTAPRSSPAVLWTDDLPLWPPNRSHEPALCVAARADANWRRDQEYRRLLYVAMTRAEDRLLVCGWHGRQEPSDTSWYALMRDGIAPIAETFEFTMDGEDGWSGDGLCLASAQTAEIEPFVASELPETIAEPALWMNRPPDPEPTPPRPLAPSRPSADPPVLSPIQADGSDRFRRGQLVHRLLQTLPDLPTSRRRDAATAFLTRPIHGVDAEERGAIADEVMRILEDPSFAPLFAPGSRAETPIVGTVTGPLGPEIISGQVDRLVIRENEVMIVDYKTNRPPPLRENDVPEAYLRQMAAYRAVMRKIWPKRPIRCVLLWTDGPRTMSLDEQRLDRFFNAS
ncbi:MAG: double-strand break repair helicase AddA [Alphaproteobacteria bacterium]|nr:double-strand break repair helicase AddA [Alphaproteobacteria bacterium]